METKTELMNASGDASVLSETAERTVANVAVSEDMPEAAKGTSTAKKKPQTRRSSRSTGKSKTDEAVKAEKKGSEKEEKSAPEEEHQKAASVSPAEEPNSETKAKKPVKKTAPQNSAKMKDVSEESEAQPEKSEEKPKTARKASKPKAVKEKKTAAPKKDETAAEAFDQAIVIPEETATVPETMVIPPEITVEVSEALTIPEEPKAESEPEKKPTKKATSQKTAEKQSDKKAAEKKSAEKKSVQKSSDAAKKKKAATARAAAEEVPVTAPSEEQSAKVVEVEPPTAEEVTVSAVEGVSGVSIETEAVFEHKEEPAEVIDVSGTPHDTFVFFSPGQLAAMEAEAAKQNEAVLITAPEEVVEVAPEKGSEGAVIFEEASDTKAAVEIEIETAPAESAEKPSEAITEDKTEGKPERRQENKRRGDPHERDVMDKERVYANLFTVLEKGGELERRILIEETMKTIPLSDEERLDNHPTSLSNRVRSVIGSVLAEQISAGKIVAAGRKLTLPSSASVADEEDIADLVEESKAQAEPEEEASVEIEIEFISEPVEHAPPAEEVTEKKALTVPQEETVEEPAEEPPTPIAVTPSEESKIPAETMSARESSIRRVRQPRGDRRAVQQPSGAGVTAILITEEEIERVILNALRRSSATKNDLFAALKHVYVEPNRLSKEEENRIYAVAGNVLQKLVNRGTLQNSDGRYLQKPSQRILNPGRAPGAYSTGNVETRFITELNRQSGDFFEQFAARLLEKYFEMSNIRVDASYVVGGSDDNGIDIMIETTDWLGYKERVFVQAKKRATQPVTLKEVREFYGALCAEEGTRGVFITTSNFCMEASKMIGKIRNLIAIDKRKLFALAEHCEVGLIRDEEGRLLLDENLFLDYDV